MTDALRRPLWKRKRWIAVTVALSMAAYPASVGPVWYGAARGWIPSSVAEVFTTPALKVAADLPDASADLFYAYLEWWWQAASR